MDAPTPTMQELLSRLSLPANQLNELSFCATTVEGIDEFLGDLPANTPEVLNRLYRAVPEVAALQGDLERRLTMLRRLQPVIFHHADLLTERLSVTDKTARQLSLAMALLKNLALGYKAVVAELLHENARNEQQLAGTIHLAISALSRMLTTSWQCFVNPPARLWREIHALFLIARTLHIEKLTPFSTQSVSSQSLAPRTAYLRILLVAAADPARFSPRDIKLLLTFLDAHAQYANLLYSGESALFTIDPDSDRGPTLSTRLRTVSTTFIGLDSAELVAHIDSFLDPAEISLPPRLVTQIHRYWTSEIMRREEHREERHLVSALFGLSRIHRLLTQTANIDGFITRSQASAISSGHHLHPAEDIAPLRMWQDTRENDTAPIGTWLQPSHNNPDDLIQFTPKKNHTPDHTVNILSATRVNASERGACIELGSAPDNPSPGELVAIREADNENWRLGLVRWTRTTASLTRLAGIEFMDRDVTPCAAAIIKDNQRASAFFPAFVTLHADGQEDLMVPSLPFAKGSQVLLVDSKTRRSICLTDVLEATHQLTLFRISNEPLV